MKSTAAVIVLSLSFFLILAYVKSEDCCSAEKDSTEQRTEAAVRTVAVKPEFMTWNWESILNFKQQLLNSLGMDDSKHEKDENRGLNDDEKKWLGSEMHEILKANRELICKVENAHYIINKELYLEVKKIEETLEEKISAANEKIKELDKKVEANAKQEEEEEDSSIIMSPEAKILAKVYSAGYRSGGNGCYLCNNHLTNSGMDLHLYANLCNDK